MSSLKPYFALAGLAMIWGASFLLIKVAVHDMSPTVLLLIRSTSGLVALAVIVKLMGRPLLGEGWKTRLGSFAIMAITNAIVPWVAIAWGEERITSGLASILNSTTTLWTAVLIFWAMPRERPSGIGYVGVVVGFAGVVILVLPDILAHGVSGNFFGAMAVLVASLSYAANAIYQRRKMRHVSIFDVSIGQLAATVIFALPLAAPSLSHVHVALKSMAAVIALGAGATGIAYLLYYYVMNSLGAVRAAGVTLLVPVTAVFWGVVLLHESLTWTIVIGMAVILAGTVLTNLRRRVHREPSLTRDSRGGLTAFLDEHAAQVRQAADRIHGYVRRTPCLTTDLSRDLRLKPECFQVTGSFKVRGAFNAILTLAGREPRPAGLIAVSSGNHAQAVALAAATVGLPALVLIPEDANPAKVAATRALGAEVIQEGITFANREERLHEEMAARGFTLVHPFNDWNVIHGQGTAARELLEDAPDIEVIATPVGGGGILSGTAISAKHHNPSIRVIGVEPAVADDAYQSWKAGSIQSLASAPATMADGVRTTSIGERTFETMFANRLVDEIVTVSEDEIAAAVRVAWSRIHLALEPTGALPLAAYLSGKLPSGCAGLILTGGNADLETVATLLRH